MPLEPIPIEVETPQFELRLEVFSGPLDLLLQLIESRELDVLTVPLAEMADAYVEHFSSRPVAAAELADFVRHRLAADPAQVAPPAPRRAAARGRRGGG